LLLDAVKEVVMVFESPASISSVTDGGNHTTAGAAEEGGEYRRTAATSAAITINANIPPINVLESIVPMLFYW
jgi:hypothetical protein